METAERKLTLKLGNAWITVSHCQNGTAEYYKAAVSAWMLEAAATTNENTRRACQRAAELNRAAAQRLIGLALAKG